MKTLLVLVGLYALAYAALSSQGRWQAAQASTAPGSPLVEVWQPKAATLEVVKRGRSDGFAVDGDTLGWAFLPAILVDRRFVHRDRPRAADG